MKFLLLFFAVLPLALSEKPKTACKCAHVECPVKEPQKCLCENEAAIQCARLCGTVPQLKFCPFGGPVVQISPRPLVTLVTAPSNTSSITPSTASSNSSSIIPTKTPSVTSSTTTPTSVPQRCGSRGLKPCPEDRFCVNDPNNPSCSTAFDCPGYCVLLDGNDCSAEFGIACPSPQQVCVDDPSDDCFPGGNLICSGKCTFLDGRSSAGFLEE